MMSWYIAETIAECSASPGNLSIRAGSGSGQDIRAEPYVTVKVEQKDKIRVIC